MSSSLSVYLGFLCRRHREARWPSGRAQDSGARGQGSILTQQIAVLYPWARYIYLPKSTGNTQEAMATSRHD